MLEDPARALAEARGQAEQSSREASEHAAPVSRPQPPIAPDPDSVPPRPPAPPALRSRMRPRVGSHRPRPDPAGTVTAAPDRGCGGDACRTLLIVLAGCAAGTINTIVGSGTLITFPTLLLLGIPPLNANISNSVGLVAGGITGTYGYRRELVGAKPDLRALMPMTFVGAIGGALLLLVLPSSAFRAIVPVLVALGILLVAFGPALSRWTERHRGQPAGTRMGPSCASESWRPVPTGLLRGGSGVILVGLLNTLTSLPLQRSNAYKNVLGTVANLVAALVFVVAAPQHVDWAVAGLIAVGALAGGWVGSTVGRRLPPPCCAQSSSSSAWSPSSSHLVPLMGTAVLVLGLAVVAARSCSADDVGRPPKADPRCQTRSPTRRIPASPTMSP